MRKFTLGLLVSGILLALFSVSAVAETVVYNDNFDVDPSVGGWAIEAVTTANVVLFNSGDEAADSEDGSVWRISKTTGDSGLVTLTRSINTTGVTAPLKLELRIRQYDGGTDVFEMDDYFEVLYTIDGTDFISLGKDFGKLNGGLPSYAVDNGMETSFVDMGEFLLPVAAGDNPNFGVRLVASTSNSNPVGENYLADTLTLVAVPEPSSLLLLGCGAAAALAMVFRRRK